MTTQRKRILVVGGVAGGASAAARARRLDEAAEILIFDRGPFVSFANCGLPYFVGNVIQEEKNLLVATPELFRERFNIEVRVLSEVTRVDRAGRILHVRDLVTGREYEERYDALVLSPGASPIRPPLPGIDLAGIFSLRTIPDSRRIRSWIEEHNVGTAVVIGGGFIGLEMTENLVKRGISVTLVEALPQVMPPFDPEMAEPLHDHLGEHGVDLRLGDAVAGFEEENGRLVVVTRGGDRISTDLVVLAIGVRPETRLAVESGLELGERGGIRVDAEMRTSDPAIWAVGDAVETRDIVTGAWGVIPLAGPANRQGRVAAEVICGRESRFRGVQGTAVCGVFEMTAASTGASEKTLRRAGMPYERAYLHPGHHAGYFPGARPITLKILFDPSTGRILGAQAVGEEGVEKRIDVIAMALQSGSTVEDLADAELCYAPQYGAAKDPVNVAGMIASNARRGDAPIARWEDLLDTRPDVLVVDVRDPREHAAGAVPGAVNIPLPDLRGRIPELPRDRPVWVHCGVGQRSYYAVRALRQNGINALNLSGGYQSYRRILAARKEGKP